MRCALRGYALAQGKCASSKAARLVYSCLEQSFRQGKTVMPVILRQGLQIAALVASLLLTWDSVAAQSSSDTEKIERLERQTELLQKQLTRQNDLIEKLQQEVSRTTKKSAKKETELARPSAPSVNRNEAAAEPAKRSQPLVDTVEQPKYVPTEAEILSGIQPAVTPTLPQFGAIKFTFWGWLEAATVYRNHNTVNDMLTVFDAIPYPNSPLYKEPQFNGTARQSQFSLLAEANIDSTQKLSGYLEWDYLGVGTESNYLVTNDWAQRLRHVYSTYDNDDLGIHILGAQNWSMMMPMEFGIVPRKELIPLTIK